VRFEEFGRVPGVGWHGQSAGIHRTTPNICGIVKNSRETTDQLPFN